jgi:hypothetical protein
VFPDDYELAVEATDSLGVIGNSAPVSIEVLTPMDNLPPEVVLLNPAEGAILHLDEDGILFEAEALDPDGTILRVDYYANDQWLGSVASSPYTFLWTDLEPPGRTRFWWLAASSMWPGVSAGLPVSIGTTWRPSIRSPDKPRTGIRMWMVRSRQWR